MIQLQLETHLTVSVLYYKKGNDHVHNINTKHKY